MWILEWGNKHSHHSTCSLTLRFILCYKDCLDFHYSYSPEKCEFINDIGYPKWSAFAIYTRYFEGLFYLMSYFLCFCFTSWIFFPFMPFFFHVFLFFLRTDVLCAQGLLLLFDRHYSRSYKQKIEVFVD